MFSGDLAFVHRPPTPAEVEKFRLLLSTFQDGSGMLAVKQGRTPNWIIRNHAVTLPGWRDFERTAALVLGGVGTENKFIYDVLLNDDLQPGKYIGISCKMRGELAKVTRLGRGSIELANAAGEFWAAVKRRTGLTEDTYSSDPALVGATLLSVVENWHMAVSASNSGNSSGNIDWQRSFFLNLLWERRTGQYRLFQFPAALPSAAELTWQVSGRRLAGFDSSGVIMEWYGHSGGQLKYYPPVSSALWSSETFVLEPLPQDLNHTLLHKAESYFPEKWGVL